VREALLRHIERMSEVPLADVTAWITASGLVKNVRGPGPGGWGPGASRGAPWAAGRRPQEHCSPAPRRPRAPALAPRTQPRPASQPRPPSPPPSRQVNLGEDDVQQVLDSLVYEGQIEEVRGRGPVERPGLRGAWSEA
jgi:hypothetical protein